MSNLALERAMEKAGIAFARARVGDRYVLELMQEKGWQLGGENSGHIICLDKHTTGDALVSALQVLTAVRESDVALGELCRELTLYPQNWSTSRWPKVSNGRRMQQWSRPRRRPNAS